MPGMSTYFEQGENNFKLPPININPTAASLRSFSGTDDFAASELITLCEDVIKESSVTEDADKISFIRSIHLPGSRALNLMQSSAFSLTDTGSEYELFKRIFLKVLGDSGRESLAKQVSHTVDSLQSKADSCPTWDG